MFQSDYDIQEAYLNSGGVKLFYKTLGSGSPLLLVHNSPGFDHVYMQPYSYLGYMHKLIFFDQRGSGKSSCEINPKLINIRSMIDDIENLRAELKLEKINICGHSWGAYLALNYVIKYPESVNSLLLYSPFSSIEFFEQFYENIYSRISADDARSLFEIEKSPEFKNNERRTYRRYMRLLLKSYFFSNSKTKKINLHFQENTIRNRHLISKILLKEINSGDITEKLKSISAPALILCGDSDPMPFESSYKVYRYLKNSKITVLKNTGFYPFIEKPNYTFRMTASFTLPNQKFGNFITEELEKEFRELERKYTFI